jgi:predicted nucleic acid-binding protein
MNLFADTSGWIALFDKSDKYHRPAAQMLQSLKGQNLFFLTSDYILDETLTHLLYTSGRQVAISFGRWIVTSSYVEITRVNEEIWTAAWKMFQAFHDKEWAFTDCTSFVLMQRRYLWQAFTFDHHFAQAGFQLWPAKD